MQSVIYIRFPQLLQKGGATKLLLANKNMPEPLSEKDFLAC